MDIHQARFEFEFSRENLLETILKNREDWNFEISEAIKDFVRNHDKYNSEKKRILENISNLESKQESQFIAP